MADETWPRCEACRGYGCEHCEGGRTRPVKPKRRRKPKQKAEATESHTLDQDGDDD